MDCQGITGTGVRNRLSIRRATVVQKPQSPSKMIIAASMPVTSGMGGGDGGGDAAPDVPDGLHRHAPRRQSGHQVVEYPVGDVLVEVALVPEAPQVELERLELDD